MSVKKNAVVELFSWEELREMNGAGWAALRERVAEWVADDPYEAASDAAIEALAGEGERSLRLAPRMFDNYIGQPLAVYLCGAMTLPVWVAAEREAEGLDADPVIVYTSPDYEYVVGSPDHRMKALTSRGFRESQAQAMLYRLEELEALAYDAYAEAYSTWDEDDAIGWSLEWQHGDAAVFLADGSEFVEVLA